MPLSPTIHLMEMDSGKSEFSEVRIVETVSIFMSVTDRMSISELRSYQLEQCFLVLVHASPSNLYLCLVVRVADECCVADELKYQKAKHNT